MKIQTAPERRINSESHLASPNGRMEAIACGVQARLEERTGYSARITSETVNIARALGVADREIERWVNQRSSQLARNDESLRGIKSILRKAGDNNSEPGLNRSPGFR
jgi:hypothetical protein